MRRPVLATALIAGLLALLPALFGQFYYGLDLTRVDVPFICELKTAIAKGHGLGVAPTIGNGEPFFANPEAQLLYPVRWLQALIPLAWSASVGVAIHLALAAAGAAFLALTFGVDAPVAITVGLIFLFGGTTIDLIRHTVFIVDAAWLPWLWGAGRVLLLESPAAGSLGVAISTAAIMLGGEPMAVIMGILVLAIESVFVLRTRQGRIRVAVLAASGTLGIGISLAQWIPSLSELKIAAHGEGFSLGANLHWSFEWAHLMAAALPGLLSHWVEQGGQHFTFWQVYNSWLAEGHSVAGGWNMNPYLGALALVFAAFAASFRTARPLAIAFVVGCVLALGVHTPVLPVLLKIASPLRSFRFPAKYFLIASLAVAVLAGVALQGLRSGAVSIARLKKALAAVFALALVAWIATLAFSSQSPAALTLKDPLLHVMAMAAASFLVLFRAPSRAATLLPVFLVLDIFVASLSSLPLGPDLTGVHSVLAGAVPGDPVFCVHTGLAGLTLGERATQDESDWNLHFSQYVFAVPNLNACDGLIGAMPYSVMTSGSRRLLREGADTFKLMLTTALGCTHVLTPAPPGSLPGVRSDAYRAVAVPKLDKIQMSGGQLGLWALQDPLPVVFSSRNPVLFSDAAAAVDAVSRGKNSGDVAAVIEDPLHAWPANHSLPAGEGVRLVHEEGGENPLVQVTGIGGAVIGLRRTFSAGWQAWQGQERLPTVRVAGSSIAAVVNDVSHGPIRWVYSPPGMRWGLLAMLLSVLAEAGLFLFLRKRPD